MLFPNSPIDSKLLEGLIELAYWPIYGEMTLTDVLRDGEFTSESVFFSYFSTIIYVCIVNVLLLNLLIAIFRYI